MATLLGNSYLFWIESATAGTYVALLGQGTFAESRSQVEIDTSDKTTGTYATSAMGLMKVTADLDVRVKLPDTGYTRLETLANGLTAFNIQLRKNGASGVSADSVFSAQVYGTIKSRSFNKDGTVDVKVGLGLAAAPTVDVLA